MSNLENNINTLQNKCQTAINDPWNNSGPSILVPVKVINQLISNIQDCHQSLKLKQNTSIEIETVIKCIHILDMFSQDVLSQPENKVGDGITKNLAIIQAIKLIKKEFQI